MRLSKLITTTSIILLGVAGTALPAQAATTYHRTKTVKVNHKPYYASSKKGHTYRFVGSIKHFNFKANHALKNYTHTTWTRTAKTAVTKHGQKVTYYRVTNAKNKATGWVAASYLKAGKNYQATTAKSVKTAPYYRAKSVKFTKLSGSNQAIKRQAGSALKAHLTYNRTKQRNLYIHGKKVRYDYVTSANKKAKGWVKASALKAGKHYQMSTPKKMAAQTFIRAKAGKIYALTGSNKALKMSHAKALSASDTYTATQSRHVYLKGKRYTYYHVTNPAGTVNGWVNRAYLKAGQHQTSTTPSVFDGRHEAVLYIGDNTTIYKDANLTQASTTLKTESSITAYPDGIRELSDRVYAIPVKVAGQDGYMKGQFQELPDNRLLPAGFYYSLSDTSFYGDVKPTDSVVKISAPFLTGTTWQYYYAGGHTIYRYDGQTWTTK